MLRIEHVIDMHCHYGPDTVGGPNADIIHDAGVAGEGEAGCHCHPFSALDAVRGAKASGYKALVLKSHSFASPALAASLGQLVPDLHVFGGICTDFPSGGLNVFAVESALQIGARIVWLPTVHSEWDLTHGKAELFGVHEPGLRVIDETGQPSAAVREIWALVKKYDAVLATGHTSAEEHYAVAKAFGGEGKILVTHAGDKHAGPQLTPRQCRELADLGATIELTALSCQSILGLEGKKPAEVVEMIREIGHTRCTLASDYGWSRVVPEPGPGLRDFMETLWSLGVAEDDLAIMAAANPARLLNLN